jgi:hypothetical protein
MLPLVSQTRPPRAVFIVESPLTARDEARFGIERLQRRGIEVVVWDISILTAPRTRAQWLESPTKVFPVEVSTQRQLETLSNDLGEHDTMILLALVAGRANPVSLSLLRVVLKSRARLSTLTPAILPDLNIGERIHLRIGRIRRVPRRVRRLLVEQYLRAKTSSGPRPSALMGPGDRGISRPLDFVWTGTATTGISSSLIHERTRIRYIHALDYVMLLDLSPSCGSKEAYCVFLDTMGPLHPDYYTQGVRDLVSMDTYSAIVCEHLARIERSLHIQTLIAAHPRARPGVMEAWYGDRQILYGQTAQLISEAELVVAAGASTSIGMAVVLQKPLSFVTALPLPSEEHIYRRAFIRHLKLKGTSIGAPGNDSTLPETDALAYRQFIERYIKRAESCSGHFWDVVADDILALP